MELLKLPDEILLEIFHNLDYFDLVRSKQVCKTVNHLLEDALFDARLFRGGRVFPGVITSSEIASQIDGYYEDFLAYPEYRVFGENTDSGKKECEGLEEEQEQDHESNEDQNKSGTPIFSQVFDSAIQAKEAKTRDWKIESVELHPALDYFEFVCSELEDCVVWKSELPARLTESACAHEFMTSPPMAVIEYSILGSETQWLMNETGITNLDFAKDVCRFWQRYNMEQLGDHHFWEGFARQQKDTFTGNLHLSVYYFGS